MGEWIRINGVRMTVDDARRFDVARYRGEYYRWFRRFPGEPFYDLCTGSFHRGHVRREKLREWTWFAFTAIEEIGRGTVRSLKAGKAAAEEALRAHIDKWSDAAPACSGEEGR